MLSAALKVFIPMNNFDHIVNNKSLCFYVVKFYKPL